MSERLDSYPPFEPLSSEELLAIFGPQRPTASIRVVVKSRGFLTMEIITPPKSVAPAKFTTLPFDEKKLVIAFHNGAPPIFDTSREYPDMRGVYPFFLSISSATNRIIGRYAIPISYLAFFLDETRENNERMGKRDSEKNNGNKDDNISFALRYPPESVLPFGIVNPREDLMYMFLARRVDAQREVYRAE